ncbi:MAG: TIM-barrel domain-containing protein [Lachnospiraceae bacterium]
MRSAFPAIALLPGKLWIFSLTLLLQSSNIGYGWWSHDIGGHNFGYRDDELECRWYQLGVFSPIMRLHSTKNEFNGKEPWQYRRDICEIMENFYGSAIS